MEPVDEILKEEEKAILIEARKRASGDTQDLVKIIDRLVDQLISERGRISSRDRVLRNLSEWHLDPAREHY